MNRVMGRCRLFKLGEWLRYYRIGDSSTLYLFDRQVYKRLGSKRCIFGWVFA